MAKKQPARKLKNVTPNFEDLNAAGLDVFNAMMSNPSDRDVALTSCAYLEDSLHALFRMGLVGGDKASGTIDSLMKPRGPLGDFNARTQMAYALGWIGPKARGYLDAIREIRNLFAHHYQIDSFDHAELDKPFETLGQHVIATVFTNPFRRDIYRLACFMISKNLNLTALSLKRPPEGKDLEVKGRWVDGKYKSFGPTPPELADDQVKGGAGE